MQTIKHCFPYFFAHLPAQQVNVMLILTSLMLWAGTVFFTQHIPLTSLANTADMQPDVAKQSC
jgi:hypothetical protein